MGNLSLLIGNDTIDSRLDRRQAHAQISIQSISLRLFRAFGFIAVTVEKPDSQR